MVMTDPIADMLTRIRNALVANHDSLEVPFSRIKEKMVAILRDEGYIEGCQTTAGEGKHKKIVITLKYVSGEAPAIRGLKNVSRPGLRVYVSKDQVPRVLNGLGVAILSTSRGILTDKESRQQNVGGEVLCYIW